MTDISTQKRWADEQMVGVENQLMPSFTPDLSELDEAGIRLDVQQTKAHGFSSTLCTAEAGMSLEETRQFLSIVTDEAGDELKVSTTLVGDSFEENHELLAYAEETGCDSVLLGFPPNWYPETAAEILDRSVEFCTATDLPVVLYVSNKFNFEEIHPSGYPLEILDDLADLETTVAVKVSDPRLLEQVHRICGDRLLVSNPIEGLLPNHVATYDMQWIGAGPYEVFQSPSNPYLVDYFDHLRAGRWDEAMDIYWRLKPIRETFMQQMEPQLRLGTYHWPAHKFYQWLSGGNGGYTRQPVMSLGKHEREEIRNAMRQAGLDPETNDEEFFVGRSNLDH